MLQLIYARDSSEATASQGVTEYLITTYFFPSSDLRNEMFDWRKAWDLILVLAFLILVLVFSFSLLVLRAQRRRRPHKLIAPLQEVKNAKWNAKRVDQSRWKMIIRSTTCSKQITPLKATNKTTTTTTTTTLSTFATTTVDPDVECDDVEIGFSATGEETSAMTTPTTTVKTGFDFLDNW